MARFRTPNFHNARLSVAQSLIRELVARRTAGAPPSGLFPAHPIMQAASTVLQRVHRGEITDAQTADDAYRHHRAMQRAQGITVSRIVGIVESVIEKIESVLESAEVCADLAARYAIAWAMDDTAKMAEIRSEWTDSACDIAGWASAVDAWLAHYWDGAAPLYYPP